MSAKDTNDETAVREFLTILEEHREECQANGMYMEAQVAQKRLEELREHERRRRSEAVRSRHLAERLDVEEAHMLEFEGFNARWDKKMQEYTERTSLLEQAMKEKHAQELRDWQHNMQNQFLLRPKYSKELLNLRHIESTLAQQKKYSEAQKLKAKADTMQKWELENLKKEWRKKVSSKQNAFVQRQQQELVAFRKRIEVGREHQKRIRQDRLNRILQRYQNIKAGLTRQQALEAVKESKAAEGALSTLPSLSGSAGGVGSRVNNGPAPMTARQSREARISTERPRSSGSRDNRPIVRDPVHNHVLTNAKTQSRNKEQFERRRGNQQAGFNSSKRGVPRPDVRTRIAKKAAQTARRNAAEDQENFNSNMSDPGNSEQQETAL